MLTKRIMINGKASMGMFYDEADLETFKDIYAQWEKLNKVLLSLNSRALNVPDILSEGLFCYLFNVCRVNGKINSKSYDAYDIKNNLGIQIKSCSIDNDCTSFGPTTVWDKLYFMHFHPGSTDGRVDIYDITKYDIENLVLNTEKKETFKMQQEQKRRPRFSIITSIIKKYDVKPIKTVYLR